MFEPQGGCASRLQRRRRPTRIGRTTRPRDAPLHVRAQGDAEARIDQTRRRAGQSRHRGEDRLQPRAARYEFVESPDDSNRCARFRVESVEPGHNVMHRGIVPFWVRGAHHSDA
ncbi:hypothetical protein K530_02832 [Streptomyces noursei CCRC 11814]|nr:hypothetical protein K530_02832 [Streptomyces noursei CCRC 11814]